MIRFVLRFLVGMLGLWLASKLVPGVQVLSLGSLVAAALLLGLANAIIRPILILLTLPLTLLTLGLFLLVINALMLELVAMLLKGFVIHGFIAAILGSIVVSLTSWVGSWLIDRQAKR